ncbi:MAG: MoaD/ThiS family protein [Promethearchaeota archaeon]
MIIPKSQVIIEDSDVNVQGALEILVKKHGNIVTNDIYNGSTLKEGLALLINGRNVLLLPKKYQTPLNDNDELIITTIIDGG